MLVLAPLSVALFFVILYPKAINLPPLWYLRAATMQTYVLLFLCPLVGAAAWMGSREERRQLSDLLGGTAHPRWARQLVSWAATTGWAVLAYLSCVAVLYGLTATQAGGGGPLWWPVGVGLASLPALSAVGFAAGACFPSRFTAPLVTIISFFALALSTQPIVGSHSYWQVSPIISGPWELNQTAGVATFFHYLPDLSIAQIMFVAGLTMAVLGVLGLPRDAGGRRLRQLAVAAALAGLAATTTAVMLVGTGSLGAGGMLVIPALHDGANDQPIRYTPICSDTAIAICMNPAYALYLPALATDLQRVLREVAGLAGAPVRVEQVATRYVQGYRNDVTSVMDGPTISGTPPVFHFVLPEQLGAPTTDTNRTAAEVRSTIVPAILARVVGGGPDSDQAQQAVFVALVRAADVGPEGSVPPGPPVQLVRPTRAVTAGAQRFAALSETEQHRWLVAHLTALRAGRITLGQLP